MKNVELLFQNNHRIPEKLRPVIKQPWLVYTPPSRFIDQTGILTMMNYFHYVNERYRMKNPICFDLNHVRFADKLTIALFECFCYALIKEYGFSIRINGIPEHDITTECLKSSPLLILSSSRKDYLQRFCEHFDLDIYQSHFRRVLSPSVAQDGSLGILSSDIEGFMRNVGIADVYGKSISDAIQELVGNASEHGCSECLIDLDITGSYVKKEDDGCTYRGVNFALVSFTDRLFGDALKEKLCEQDYDASNPRYQYVQNAFENHKAFFSTEYSEEDFYQIAAFQHKITSRPGTTRSGGTGLTKVIQTLEDLAESHSCYMISGKHKIVFLRSLLEYDKDTFIGFNKEQSFLLAPPDRRVISKSKIYIPGTAYNLNFVMKEI